jgi:hypothetical protein
MTFLPSWIFTLDTIVKLSSPLVVASIRVLLAASNFATLPETA